MKERQIPPEGYEIESGIPLPRNGRPPIYQLRHMEVGQSFFVPDVSRNNMTSIYATAKRMEIKVSVRKVREKDTNGVRIWRVA